MTDDDALVMRPVLAGLVPEALRPASRKVHLEGLELMVDIGFHAHEIGTPQRLLVNVDVWVDTAHFPRGDRVSEAWDYHWLREGVLRLVAGRRFNLQETVAHEIYDLVAARAGVLALSVSTRKPDVYEDCAAAGVTLSSF